MTAAERRIYELEKLLIRDHFPGLRPRPIKLVPATSRFLGQADEPNLLISRAVLDNEAELQDTVTHELIHYKLKDGGKEYHGHGEAFLRKAKTLGILGRIELKSCLSAEEYFLTPTRRELREVPRRKFAEAIDERLEALMKLIERLPQNRRVPFFREIRNLEVSWRVYFKAAESGQQNIVEEVTRKKPGPKGKRLDEFLKERDTLQVEFNELVKHHGVFPEDPRVRRQIRHLDDKLANIQEKLERDFGCS